MDIKKYINKIKSGQVLKPHTITALRKVILNEDFEAFEELLNLVDKSKSISSQMAFKVIYLAPKYLSNAESILKFKKIIDSYDYSATTSVPRNQAISNMANQVILNPHLPIEYKFSFYKQSGQTVDGSKLSSAFLDYSLKEFYTLNLSKTPPGLSQLIFQSLTRKDITSIKELNDLLVKFLNHNKTSQFMSEFNEDLIKSILKFPKVSDFDNNLFLECLNAWNDLINKTQIKFNHNNHHQTKKRLHRLQNEYQSMRELFRNSLSTKGDSLSVLDSFLMG